MCNLFSYNTDIGLIGSYSFKQIIIANEIVAQCYKIVFEYLTTVLRKCEKKLKHLKSNIIMVFKNYKKNNDLFWNFFLISTDLLIVQLFYRSVFQSLADKRPDYESFECTTNIICVYAYRTAAKIRSKEIVRVRFYLFYICQHLDILNKHISRSSYERRWEFIVLQQLRPVVHCLECVCWQNSINIFIYRAPYFWTVENCIHARARTYTLTHKYGKVTSAFFFLISIIFFFETVHKLRLFETLKIKINKKKKIIEKRRRKLPRKNCSSSNNITIFCNVNKYHTVHNKSIE